MAGIGLIIVAGGVGSRMQSDTPKQFMLLRGKPVLQHSLEQFAKTAPEMQIIVALPEKLIPNWEKLCLQYSCTVKHSTVIGGKERFHSVRNALSKIDDLIDYVFVHDAVRPLISESLIKNCLLTAKEKGNAIPAIAPVDSIRSVALNGDSEIINRNSLRIIQTPQCFEKSVLAKAYKNEYRSEFTDDASVVEFFGEKINLIEGERTNLKITTPSDLLIAEALLDFERKQG